MAIGAMSVFFMDFILGGILVSCFATSLLIFIQLLYVVSVFELRSVLILLIKLLIRRSWIFIFRLSPLVLKFTELLFHEGSIRRKV